GPRRPDGTRQASPDHPGAGHARRRPGATKHGPDHTAAGWATGPRRKKRNETLRAYCKKGVRPPKFKGSDPFFATGSKAHGWHSVGSSGHGESATRSQARREPTECHPWALAPSNLILAQLDVCQSSFRVDPWPGLWEIQLRAFRRSPRSVP